MTKSRMPSPELAGTPLDCRLNESAAATEHQVTRRNKCNVNYQESGRGKETSS